MCKGSRYCDPFDTGEGGSHNPDDDDLSDEDDDDVFDDDDDGDLARCVEEALTTSITTHSGNAATG